MPLRKELFFKLFFPTAKFRLPLSSRGMGVKGLNGTAIKKKPFFCGFPNHDKGFDKVNIGTYIIGSLLSQKNVFRYLCIFSIMFLFWLTKFGGLFATT